MGLSTRPQGYIEKATACHLLLGAVQERRSQDTADPFDRDIPGIRTQDQERRLDNRILAGGHSEGDVEAARRIQIRSEPVAWMEHLAENTLDLVSALFQIGDDDADLKRRGSGVRLAFSRIRRAHSAAARISRLASARPTRIAAPGASGYSRSRTGHPALCEGVDQPLLGGRSFMKSRELDCVRGPGPRPLRLRSATTDGSSAFENQPLSRQRPRNSTAQAWKASESAEFPHVSASSDRFQSHRSLHDLRAALAVAGISSNWFSVSC